jgi:hypothetical protein
MEFGFWLRLEFVDGTKFLLCLRLRLQENDDTDLCGLLPGWSWAMRIQLEWASWKNRKEKRGERRGVGRLVSCGLETIKGGEK